ncbi:uncharacterized protein LOC111380347 [Olea europaea var. sylvestris]|uniref:Uncharacterized protein n=1 Tax=Olea europaea subsp. europaea TaxID=158383 RepID=A0A8S0TWQ9_OLEEU|nr:uncharacterized protein LOC111380347 [Olea europaea var. sylvestris]CAA3007919.1 Hypothetical predicted protein [Olea europaea subsp. europaea]
MGIAKCRRDFSCSGLEEMFVREVHQNTASRRFTQNLLRQQSTTCKSRAPRSRMYGGKNHTEDKGKRAIEDVVAFPNNKKKKVCDSSQSTESVDCKISTKLTRNAYAVIRGSLRFNFK